MLKLFSYLIFTNILLWFPLIVMSLMSFCGYKFPLVANALSAIVSTPVNSFLSPLDYSRVYGKAFLFVSEYVSRAFEIEFTRSLDMTMD